MRDIVWRPVEKTDGKRKRADVSGGVFGSLLPVRRTIEKPVKKEKHKIKRRVEIG